jgi:hypothetical protein
MVSGQLLETYEGRDWELRNHDRNLMRTQHRHYENKFGNNENPTTPPPFPQGKK